MESRHHRGRYARGHRDARMPRHMRYRPRMRRASVTPVVTAAWLVAAVVLGALQAVAFRGSMNPDGIAYLDMGDAYVRGDWATAIRSHWSPLYAWLLGVWLRLVRPDAAAEFPLVHLVNLLIFVVAAAAFTL